MSLTFGSLFAGIGGLDLGLERAGMVCEWQVEIDEYRRKVLSQHWPDVPKWSDIHTFPPSDGGYKSVDLICGGDPCQENSNARQNTGLLQRSLGGEFVRIIDVFRPRLVLRENPSAVRSDAPWPWQRFRSALEDIGYSVLPFRLRACCLGADHRRDRLFLLAERADPMQAGLQGNVIEKIEREGWGESLRNSSKPDRRSPAPRISGGADGIPHRVDRIKSLGDAVVPQVSEWIGRRIIEVA